MIQANKAMILTDFNLGSLSLQFLEIEYFLLVFDRITRIASLLAGFASAALLQTASAKPGYTRLHFLHVLATGGALGLMLLVLLISTFCSMWGPGLALRGCGTRSVSQAVEVMDWAQKAALRFLNWGLWCYLLSTAISAWAFQPPLCCFVLIGILITGMMQLYASDFELKRTFMPKAVTKGEIKGNPLGRAAVSAAAGAAASSDSSICCGYAAAQGVYTPGEMMAYSPTSASSTAETLRMPSWTPPEDEGACTPEQDRHSHHTSDSNSSFLSPPETHRPRQQTTKTFHRIASSAYTTAMESLASFVGLTGEDAYDKTAEAPVF